MNQPASPALGLSADRVKALAYDAICARFGITGDVIAYIEQLRKPTDYDWETLEELAQHVFTEDGRLELSNGLVVDTRRWENHRFTKNMQDVINLHVDRAVDQIEQEMRRIAPAMGRSNPDARLDIIVLFAQAMVDRALDPEDPLSKGIPAHARYVHEKVG